MVCCCFHGLNVWVSNRNLLCFIFGVKPVRPNRRHKDYLTHWECVETKTNVDDIIHNFWETEPETVVVVVAATTANGRAQQRNATTNDDVIAPTLFIRKNNKIIIHWISIHTTGTRNETRNRCATIQHSQKIFTMYFWCHSTNICMQLDGLNWIGLEWSFSESSAYNIILLIVLVPWSILLSVDMHA